MVTRTIPPSLDRLGLGHPAGAGRRPRIALLRWAIRWIQFILRRCYATRQTEAALLLAAAALASAEETEDEERLVRGRQWYDSLQGGHIADLRGFLHGRWLGGQNQIVTMDTHPL